MSKLLFTKLSFWRNDSLIFRLNLLFDIVRWISIINETEINSVGDFGAMQQIWVSEKYEKTWRYYRNIKSLRLSLMPLLCEFLSLALIHKLSSSFIHLHLNLSLSWFSSSSRSLKFPLFFFHRIFFFIILYFCLSFTLPLALLQQCLHACLNRRRHLLFCLLLDLLNFLAQSNKSPF